jgi:DNA-binding NarL/FixJ family response regulator
MINIILADNQALTCEGVKFVLADIIDIQIAGIARTNAELEQLISTFNPGLIIIDPHYSYRFTLPDVKNIRSAFNTLPILIFSNRQEKNRVLEAIDMGIRNYIFKECSREELIHAIYTTAKGEQFYCRNTYEVLFGSKLLPERDETLPALSLRETELLHLVAEGMTNKEIAEKLFLSIHTVKTHRKNIIKKLGFTFKNIAEVSSLIQSGRFTDK